jgi:hypothetical protein
MMQEPRFLPALALLLAGLLAWIAHFGLIYAYTGLFCERPDWARLKIGDIGIVPFGIAALTVLALTGLIAVLAVYGLLRPRAGNGATLFDERFYRQVAQGSALLGAIGIIWQGLLSIALVPSCW